MRSTLMWLALAGAWLGVCGWMVPASAEDGVFGRWAFGLPDGRSAWLKLGEAGDEVRGELLWSVGSARPVEARFRWKTWSSRGKSRHVAPEAPVETGWPGTGVGSG